MTITLRELAALVNGELVGNGDIAISGAAPLRDAAEGQITYIDHERHLPRFHDSQAPAAVVGPAIPVNGKPVIRVQDPLGAFGQIVSRFHNRVPPKPMGIHPRAFVDPTASIGPEMTIGPMAVIGPGSTIGARCTIHAGAVVGANCRLGDDVTLFANAVLYDETILGHRVIIHSNAVIGADGFGYRLQGGRHVKVPQLGHVEIGDDVEIGAGTTVDRGTFGATRVGAGSKIDNQVQIGHNCQVGKHNIFVSQVGMGGSSSTGEYVVIAGQVGIVDHVHIGDRAVVGGQSAVVRDLPPNDRYLYSPAMPERDAKRIVIALPEVPKMRKTLKKIVQKLGMEEDAE